MIPLIHKRLSQTYAFGDALTVNQTVAVVGAAHVFHQYVQIAALARHGDFDLRLLVVAVLYAHELAVHIDVSAVVYVLQHNGQLLTRAGYVRVVQHKAIAQIQLLHSERRGGMYGRGEYVQVVHQSCGLGKGQCAVLLCGDRRGQLGAGVAAKLLYHLAEQLVLGRDCAVLIHGRIVVVAVHGGLIFIIVVRAVHEAEVGAAVEHVR